MIEIRALREDERGWADERYREIRFSLSTDTARVFVAELGGARVGLGRLVALAPEVLELGGIWTDEAARNRGVAREMVARLIEQAPPGRLWCIPFVHLSAFYESFGFEMARPPWPPTIAAKAAELAAQHVSHLVLVRGAKR